MTMSFPPILQAPPDYDAMVDRIINTMLAEYPTWGVRDTDPGYALIRAICQDINLAYVYFNSQIRGILVDYAIGADLDAIGALLGVPRRSNEPDSRYRPRIKSAPNRQVVGTKDSIEAAAESLDGVKDALLVPNYTAGTGTVYMIADDGGTADDQVYGYPNAALVTSVGNTVNDDSNKHFLDQLSAAAPSTYFRRYRIAARVNLRDPSSTGTQNSVRQGVYNYIRSAAVFGGAIRTSAIFGAIFAASTNVENATLTLLALDSSTNVAGTGVADIPAPATNYTVTSCILDSVNVALTFPSS